MCNFPSPLSIFPFSFYSNFLEGPNFPIHWLARFRHLFLGRKKKKIKRRRVEKMKNQAKFRKMAKIDHYKVLGLKPTATPDEIKKAYRTFFKNFTNIFQIFQNPDFEKVDRKAALSNHPDRNPDNKEKVRIYAAQFERARKVWRQLFRQQFEVNDELTFQMFMYSKIKFTYSGNQ